MPALKTYDIFISHAWRYGDDYDRLENLLRSAAYFKWRNYSAPSHDPIIDPETPVGKTKLISLLNNQIRPVNCVIIIGGMYAAYSEWIRKEIDLAKRLGKPIIGVYPWGQLRMPREVQEASWETVNWQTAAIVSAIRRHAI